MKGWKETYINIVAPIEEEYGFKEKKLVRDLEKAIDKTGDLIKQIPEEMEMIDGDYSESYQELNSGQNALEYGIRHLESDLKDYHEKQESKNESVNERIDFHSKSPAELKGSEFDRKKEINGYKKILKAIEKINKDHEKFQYNNRADGPSNIFKGLQQVERTCYEMMREIEQGKWDGKVDLES